MAHLGITTLFDLQKPTDPAIKASAMVVVGRQLALRAQPDFVKHPAEEQQTVHLFGGMSETGNFHGPDIR